MEIQIRCRVLWCLFCQRDGAADVGVCTCDVLKIVVEYNSDSRRNELSCTSYIYRKSPSSES